MADPVASSGVARSCYTCDSPALNRCKHCQLVHYCSLACQTTGWGTHQLFCQSMAALKTPLLLQL